MSSQANDTNWAVNEFAAAELGDPRRTTRVIELATALAQPPTASLPEACSQGAMLKAAYRFFSHDAIAPQDVLHSHIAATYSRLDKLPLVLAVQDTTEVDWTSHPATKDLGPLRHKACQGLHVHSTLALTPERVPLGLLAQQVWARDPDEVGKRTRCKQLPIRQKESHTWLASLDAVFRARSECPETRVISVGDREADVYDLLAAERPRFAVALGQLDPPHRRRLVWASLEPSPQIFYSRLEVRCKLRDGGSIDATRPFAVELTPGLPQEIRRQHVRQGSEADLGILLRFCGDLS